MAVAVPDNALLVGFGRANQAVARALLQRGRPVEAVDDRPSDDAVELARALGVALHASPSDEELAGLIDAADAMIPAPGLPDHHPAFALARAIPVLSEFDLAAAWDDRPVVSITGTDGKTTVTTLVTAMFRAAGVPAVDAGNNDLPLVAAIDDADPEWFVVEASSFRLGRSLEWAPRVGTWLNFAPDHLDVHGSIDGYAAAKARIWTHQGPGDVAIGNLDDPVVAAHLAAAPGERRSFSLLDATADHHLRDGVLHGPGGPLLAVDDLPRALPHDLSNALAAAASATAAGIDDRAIAEVLSAGVALPHRVAHVASIDGIAYYDDSKATAPHATLAAVAGFDSVVLIAGGSNKGLDLGALADAAPRVRSVVAIGDAADEVVAAFAGRRPVVVARSMDEAVRTARAAAAPGDVVLLSPACASFDWYRNYGERGDDFARAVTEMEVRA